MEKNKNKINGIRSQMVDDDSIKPVDITITSENIVEAFEFLYKFQKKTTSKASINKKASNYGGY